MTKTFKLSENLRRNIARFFLPILTVWLTVMPSQSYAVLPLVIAGVAAADSAAAAAALSASIASATAGAAAATTLGVVAIDAGMTAATGLIGTIAAFIILTYPDGSEHRIPTTTDPAKQVLSPVAPATATPISTSGFGIYNITVTGYIGTGSTAAAACSSAGGTGISMNSAGRTMCDGLPCGLVYAGCTGSVASRDVVGSSNIACPAGYSGVSCALVDARAAQPDNKCDFGRSGGGFAMITDPDCAKNLNVNGNADGSLDFTGKDKYGRPLSIHFKPTASGGTEVGITVQGVDAAGNSVNTNLNLNVNPAAVIDGATQTQTTPSGAPATSPAVNPATGTTPATTATPSTDYARQGEAAAATAPVTAELQKLNANYAPVTPVDPSVPLNTDVPTFGSAFNNLTGFKLPGHVSACPTPSVDLSTIGMGVHTLNSHCNLLNSNSAPIRTSMIIVFLISALFIVLRA